MARKPTYEKLEHTENVLAFENDKFQIDMSRKRFLAKAMLVIGLPTVAFFGINDFMQGRYFVTSLDVFILIVLTCLCLGLYKSIQEKREYMIYRVCFTLFVILFGTIFIFAIGMEGKFDRTQLSYIYPILVFFLIGAKEGLLWALLFYCGMASLILFTDFEPIAIEELKTRFLFSFFMVSLLAYLSEYLVRSNQEKLFSIQGDLRKSENLYREAYGKLKDETEEHKQTEKSLRESEERFRHAFENANTGVCLVSADGRFLKVNDRLCEIFGHSKEKLEGMPVNDITHPEDVELSPEFFKRSISGEMENIVYEKRYIHGKGHIVWGQISSSIVQDPEGEPLYFISHVQDITQHKLAEEALKKSEEKFSKLFQASPAYISLATLEEGRFVAVNDAFTRVTGYEQSEVIGRTFREIGLWPDPHDRDDFIGQIEKDGRQYLQEVTLTRKDGGLIEGLWSVEKIELGGKDHLISMLIDITERKQIQEDLRESEQRFREMADLLPTIVCEIDMDLRVTYANSLAFETTGFTQEDFEAGINAMDLLHPGDREKAAKRIEQTVKGVKLNPAEYRLLRKDGSEIPVLLNSAPIYKDGEMVGIRACLVDIGEQNELQSRLQKAQRMEALGLMAGGVAHDLNNILSGIVTYPELILMGLPEDSPLRKPLKTMQESGMKAADVVSDMLTIARGATISKEVSNLNTIVKGYLASVEHQKLGKAFLSLTFKTDLDPGLLNVSCSKIHIEKALMNLVINASEAIEQRGTVSISTMNRYLDEPLKGYDDVTIGEYALLRVSDDGPGILPDDLDRVFEPFYSKKEMGRSGTGLGLAVVWNTIQDHDGYVEVKSSEKGTIFELYFPVTRERMAEEEEEVPLEDYLGHGERILVVDDEERQREIASGLLTQLNYNVEAVSSGEEAIEYVKEHPVDLIVLDMVMPRGINGRKTYEEIIKIRPKQKAIIASGYAKTREVDIAQRLGAGKYIKKPYILEKIGVAVKEELEK